MVTEFIRIPAGHPDTHTDFQIGELVSCLIDPLYEIDSFYDCGKNADGIGIVIDISFFQRLSDLGLIEEVICELEIYWFETMIVSYHLDKNVKKLDIMTLTIPS